MTQISSSKKPEDKTVDSLTLYFYSILNKYKTEKEFTFESEFLIKYYRTLVRAQNIVDETNANPNTSEDYPISDRWKNIADNTINTYETELRKHAIEKNLNFNFTMKRAEVVCLHAMCYTATRRRPEKSYLEKLAKAATAAKNEKNELNNTDSTKDEYAAKILMDNVIDEIDDPYLKVINEELKTELPDETETKITGILYETHKPIPKNKKNKPKNPEISTYVNPQQDTKLAETPAIQNTPISSLETKVENNQEKPYTKPNTTTPDNSNNNQIPNTNNGPSE